MATSLEPGDSGHSIPARLARIADGQPNGLAVAGQRYTWSWSQLQQETARVAAALAAWPGGEDRPVALLFEHDAPLLAALLGALRAGRFFAVLDPGFPHPRNQAILANLGAAILVSDQGNVGQAARLANGRCQVILYEALPDAAACVPAPMAGGPERPLGIFQTTGSTGAPKGVLWRQERSLWRAEVDRADIPVRPGDRHALFTHLGFPAAASDTFGALLNGASLHLYDVRGLGTHGLAAWLRREAIDYMRMPVALFRHFLDGLGEGEPFPALRAIGLSGDALCRQDVVRARAALPADCRIVYRYSLSEAGMCARRVIAGHAVAEADPLTVGRPAPGRRIVVLDDRQMPVAPGDMGEIAVDADGLAAGYWSNGRCAALATFADPLAPDRGLYRTGDLGRLHVDGRLELAGRRDARVKVRGYRVETGAVEAALRGVAAVRAAAVTVCPDRGGESCLVAYVVTAGPGMDETGLRRQLGESLPRYMLPSHFVFLDALPLAANGKLDRATLPKPGEGQASTTGSGTLPRTPTEAALIQIWQEVLGCGSLDIHADFFALGGHSLAAARALAQINASFRLDLALALLYQTPTVAGFAAVVDEARAGAERAAGPDLEQLRRNTLRQLGWS